MYLHCCPIKSCTTVHKVTQPVREERRDDGDAVGGGEPEGVDEEEELHEAVVGPGVHPQMTSAKFEGFLDHLPHWSEFHATNSP